MASTYQRVLLKLSGEALMADEDSGIDPVVAHAMAGQIRAVHQRGIRKVDGVDSADPRTGPSAVRYDHISHHEALEKHFPVMDARPWSCAGEIVRRSMFSM